mmetsp:Transcript_57757/g.171814  ORF Transcript_57757/g.171814 Transcript_57757/m.171814 type:complete len:232 (-) Transcript_57757:33-728(-)
MAMLVVVAGIHRLTHHHSTDEARRGAARDRHAAVAAAAIATVARHAIRRPAAWRAHLVHGLRRGRHHHWFAIDPHDGMADGSIGVRRVHLCRVVLATRAEEDQQDAEHGEENKHAGRRTVVFTMRVMQPRVVPPPLRRVVRVVGARRRAADVVRGRAREAAVRAATIVALGIAGIGATVCDSRAAKRLAAERAAALARRALVRLGAVPAGRAALLARRVKRARQRGGCKEK